MEVAQHPAGRLPLAAGRRPAPRAPGTRRARIAAPVRRAAPANTSRAAARPRSAARPGRRPAGCDAAVAQRQVLRAPAALRARRARRPPRATARPAAAPRATSALNTRSPRSSTSSRPCSRSSRQNLRRAQARRPQRPGDGGERAHHVLGQMRDAAVGLAVADRRAVRLARRIHQQRRAAVARRAARSCASRHRPAGRRCARRASRGWPVQERHHIADALRRGRRAAAKPAHRDAPHVGIARFRKRDLDARLRQQSRRRAPATRR